MARPHIFKKTPPGLPTDFQDNHPRSLPTCLPACIPRGLFFRQYRNILTNIPGCRVSSPGRCPAPAVAATSSSSAPLATPSRTEPSRSPSGAEGCSLLTDSGVIRAHIA